MILSNRTLTHIVGQYAISCKDRSIVRPGSVPPLLFGNMHDIVNLSDTDNGTFFGMRTRPIIPAFHWFSRLKGWND